MEESWIDPGGESVAGVSIQNLTNTSCPDVEQILERIPSFVLEAESGGQVGEITIVLTIDAHLAQLHGEHLGDWAFTDVMTFPHDENDEVISGDIVISVDRAVEQADEEQWSVEDEIQFIAIHGMLHLCGWVDHTVAEREKMHSRQREIMHLLNTERELLT